MNYYDVYDFSKKYENAEPFYLFLKELQLKNIRTDNMEYWLEELSYFLAEDYDAKYYNPFAVLTQHMDLRIFMEIRKSLLLQGIKPVHKDIFQKFIEEISDAWSSEQIIKHRENFINTYVGNGYIECSYSYFRVYYYCTDKPDGIVFNMSYFLDDFDHSKDDEIIKYWIPFQANWRYKGDIRLVE